MTVSYKKLWKLLIDKDKECIRDKDFRDILSLQACIIDDAEYLDEKI